MNNENEHFLADWLSGKLSDDELQQLVTPTDFTAFQKIKATLDNSVLSAPSADADFAKIKQKLTTQKVIKVGAQAQTNGANKKTIPLWTYAVAACLLVAFGFYQLYYLSNEVQTQSGTNKTVVLADRSKVTVNAKSKFCYGNLFRYNRTIELEGEAFFEVTKGSTFTVKTALGKVTVLGTKFNVASFSDYFEVACYEGKVKVERSGKMVVLTKGESLRSYNSTFENWAGGNTQEPLWIKGETSLRKVPVRYVFAQFEKQFGVRVTYPPTIQNSKFTGSFSNSNIETALQSICVPLQLNYSKTASGVITISE